MVAVSDQLVNFVRPSEHASRNPSGIDMWMNCPASIELQKGIPEEVKAYATEGTLAHQIAEDYFVSTHYGLPASGELMMAEQDMMEGAQMHYDCIVGWLNNKEDIGEVIWFGLEKGIPIFPELDSYGTGDVIIVGTKGCATIDFKYGKKPVSAKSAQLLAYLLGVYRHLIDVPADYVFNAVIVQPRTDMLPKVEEYALADIKDFEAKVYAGLLKSNEKNLEPNPGNHCFWCKARRTQDPLKKCPAIKNKALQAANENFDSFFEDMNAPIEKIGAPNDKRDKALLKVMSLEPMIVQISKDARDEFLYRIENGEVIEGLEIVEEFGRSKWKEENPQKMAGHIAAAYGHVEKLRGKVIATETKTKVINIGDLKKIVGSKDFDESLIVKPIKKKIHVQDRTTKEVLGGLAAYSQMIGLNLDEQ